MHGVVAPVAGSGATRVRLVLEGLRSFQAYDALRRALIEELNVRSAIPLELTRGRAVLEVDCDYDTDTLLGALLDSAEPGLRVVPVTRDRETLPVLVERTAPVVPPQANLIETKPCAVKPSSIGRHQRAC